MSKRQVMEFGRSKPGGSDAKRMRILECAFDVVMRYGYRRMTMDDIAKACAMSRPALYLQFKNKGEIYIALTSGMTGQALEGTKAALGGSGTIEDRLFSAIKVGILDPIEFLSASAHGAELLDMKQQMASDVIQDWHTKMAALIADALEAAGVAKARSLTGRQLAYILLDSIDGLKQRAQSAQERCDGAKALVKLIAR
jgi:AcrR family transcriptional regulator